MIKTKEDWWHLLDANWENIKRIVFHHLDPNAPAYEEPGNKDSKLTGRLLFLELEALRVNRDPQMHRYLNVSWCMASDAYAYSVPSWGEFCDLCSENWVFDEEIVLDKN